MDIAGKAVASARVPAQWRDDALSEAAVAILESAKTYDPVRGSADAWAFVCARSAVWHYLRREYRHATRTAPLSTEPAAPDPYHWIEVREALRTALGADDWGFLARIAVGYQMSELSKLYRLSGRAIREKREVLMAALKQ